MRTAKPCMGGGSYGNASACCCTGDFGVSMFHRTRRCQRPAESSLNRLPNDSVPSGEQFAEPRVRNSLRPTLRRYRAWFLSPRIPRVRPRVPATPSGLVARRSEGYTH
jgi:hypothetical protein